MFFAGTAVVIVGVMAWALLGSSLLVVRSVQVAGKGKVVSAGQVLAAARMPNGAATHLGRHRRHLPPGRAAQAGAVGPGQQGLAEHAGDHRPTAQAGLRAAGARSYALVDAFGVSVRDVARRPPGMPVLTVNTTGGSLRGSPAVRAAAAVLAELPRRCEAGAGRVTPASGRGGKTTCRSSWRAEWGASLGLSRRP